MMRRPLGSFHRESSRNGKQLSELKSGLQKYIRRGNQEMALWCTGELLSFRLVEAAADVTRIATNVLHRFMVIALEDVGEIGIWHEVDVCLRSLRRPDFTRIVEPTAGELAVAEPAAHRLVCLLVATPKSRACSHARAVAKAADYLEDNLRLSALYPEIVDLHRRVDEDPRRATRPLWAAAFAEALAARERTALIWGWLIFTEGIFRRTIGGTAPAWTLFDILEAVGKQSRAIPMGTIALARRWFKEMLKLRESFLCWMIPCLAILDDLEPADAPEYKEPPGELFPDVDRELDDFVFDIHTGVRRDSAGALRFVLEGATVDIESKRVDPVWRAFYEDVRRIDDGGDPVGPPARLAPAPTVVQLTGDELDELAAVMEDWAMHGPPAT